MKSIKQIVSILVLIRNIYISLMAMVFINIALAADIDIYGPSGAGTPSNLMLLLDNTSNWSNTANQWNTDDLYASAGCTSLSSTGATTLNACDLIEKIFYRDSSGGVLDASHKRPWDSGYRSPKDTLKLEQGRIQLRAIKLVINELICGATVVAPLNINVGLMLMAQGSRNSPSHGVGVVYYALQNLVRGGIDSCSTINAALNAIDSKITDPAYKAPSSANYGAPMYEIFKYFGGHTNPVLASTAEPHPGTPVAYDGYGVARYSAVNALDDANAFSDAARLIYKNVIGVANSCANNYLLLVGNAYPNAEPESTGKPTVFQDIGYTPPALSSSTSDTSRYADEWAYFLANTDVSDQAGIQRVMTMVINTYKSHEDANQTKLLKSMAANGGLGVTSAYYEVNGNLLALYNAFKDAFVKIADKNSVFTASTLPVSTTTQGTFLNQVFIGSFRPDADFSPRWIGNVKQYQLGYTLGQLDLQGADSNTAIYGSFFSPNAKSFWTKDSIFFANGMSGTPASFSDLPDGAIVEKGGVAQMLRDAYLTSAASRNVYTLGSTLPALGTALSSTLFSGTLSGLSSAEVAWARGENNVAFSSSSPNPGQEEFVGTYSPSGTAATGTTLPTDATNLPTSGARHSIHGDVLHSRPIALNYGNGQVVIYYGTNAGFLHAVDGRKPCSPTPCATAGHELWSFVAPEHYPLIQRLRNGSPELFLPETNSSGTLLTVPSGKAAKSYGVDGPIGVYARYNVDGNITSTAGDGTEAMIFVAMRRGGRMVYAFDVKNPTSPKFLWKISGGGSGDFANLAQTWSMPKVVSFPNNSNKPPVLIFMGGGYDPAEDGILSPSASAPSTRIGNVVYVINARTGKKIASITTAEMYSVPSDITLVDLNNDGIKDRAYFADVRGNVFRFDLPTIRSDLAAGSDNYDTALGALSWPTAPTKIASLNGKVFYPPDAFAVGGSDPFVAVLLGTGDREKPLLNSNSDHFFLIKDKVGAAGAVLTRSDLKEVATTSYVSNRIVPAGTANDTVDTKGCYITLDSHGEKVVNAPFTIAGATYFGTNMPKPSGASVCVGDLGVATSYAWPLFCGLPRSQDIKDGGMPPSPVGGIVTLNELTGKKESFLIGGGTSGSPFAPERPVPSISPVRKRLYWRIENSNR